ncbi:MAG: transposase [Fimbriimonadaceae bacterium]|nr:transposase [Fimbriimonadaceae bacterium]
MNARIVGIDVAKDTLSCWSQGRAVEIANRRTEIRRFLKGPPPDSVVGVEVTSSYHRTAVDLAFETGFEVYALNPVDCARYRQALHGRGKTDEIDARLIARFVERERDSLRRYAPLPENVRRLKDLLSRRETMVKARAMMGQSLEGVPDLAKPAKGALEGVDRLIRSLGEAISSLTDEMEGKDLLPSVPAVGPLGAAQALSVPTTGGFKSARRVRRLRRAGLPSAGLGTARGQARPEQAREPVLAQASVPLRALRLSNDRLEALLPETTGQGSGQDPGPRGPGPQDRPHRLERVHPPRALRSGAPLLTKTNRTLTRHHRIS